MHYGFAIVKEMISGLNDYLDSKGMAGLDDLIGKSRDTITTWNNLNLNYKIVARVDQDRCIHCNKCFIACEDAAHQCIDQVLQEKGVKNLVVDEEHCVGCNLCMMVCPVDCIDMIQVNTGLPPESWKQRSEALA
jgi:dihydropyrimidine dehydrogenase (NAD+) subunit PreA